jgi:hypothetical protein
MWGYPFTALLFLTVTGWFLVNTIITRPVPALAGLGFIVAGIPVYLLWHKPTPVADSVGAPSPETTPYATE